MFLMSEETLHCINRSILFFFSCGLSDQIIVHDQYYAGSIIEPTKMSREGDSTQSRSETLEIYKLGSTQISTQNLHY